MARQLIITLVIWAVLTVGLALAFGAPVVSVLRLADDPPYLLWLICLVLFVAWAGLALPDGRRRALLKCR